MPTRLESVRSFAVYYGRDGEERLSAYDLVVLEPSTWTADGVALVKRGGTVALAYISVLEVPASPEQPPPAGVLRQCGAPVCSAGQQNWVLDARAPETALRLRELAEHALRLGFDGLFLDTMADLEDLPLGAALSAVTLPAAARLVAGLRSRCGCLLVQNRGLSGLLPLTAPYLEGVCWEGFPHARIGQLPSVHSGVRALQALQSAGPRVLALNDGIAEGTVRRSARASAAQCGFLWYGTRNYTDLPPLPSEVIA